MNINMSEESLHRRMGRPKRYETLESLLEACYGYFTWVEANPIIEQKMVSYQGVSVLENLPRTRAMNLSGLCLRIKVSRQTWRSYREDAVLGPAVEMAEQVIYDWNFTHAAVDMLNPTLIAKQLGLIDKHDMTSSDGSMSQKSTIDVSKLSTETLREIIEAQTSHEDQVAVVA